MNRPYLLMAAVWCVICVIDAISGNLPAAWNAAVCVWFAGVLSWTLGQQAPPAGHVRSNWLGAYRRWRIRRKVDAAAAVLWNDGIAPETALRLIEISDGLWRITETTKDQKMKAAINELEIALSTMETNEPINRKEGKTDQADLEAKNAADFRQALAVLRAADAGPIWPAPKA